MDIATQEFPDQIQKLTKSEEIRWTTICRQMHIRCHLQNAKRMVKHLQIRRDVGSIGPLLNWEKMSTQNSTSRLWYWRESMKSNKREKICLLFNQNWFMKDTSTWGISEIFQRNTNKYRSPSKIVWEGGCDATKTYHHSSRGKENWTHDCLRGGLPSAHLIVWPIFTRSCTYTPFSNTLDTHIGCWPAGKFFWQWYFPVLNSQKTQIQNAPILCHPKPYKQRKSNTESSCTGDPANHL